jgi:hypothetical protein
MHFVRRHSKNHPAESVTLPGTRGKCLCRDMCFETAERGLYGNGNSSSVFQDLILYHPILSSPKCAPSVQSLNYGCHHAPWNSGTLFQIPPPHTLVPRLSTAQLHRACVTRLSTFWWAGQAAGTLCLRFPPSPHVLSSLTIEQTDTTHATELAPLAAFPTRNNLIRSTTLFTHRSSYHP